jgi:MFS family permease
VASEVVERTRAPAPLRRWFLLGVLTTLYATSLIDRQVFALLIEPIRKSVGVDDFRIALLQGLSFAMFYAVFGLAFGWAADRSPRRGLVMIGVSVWSLATMGCGLARDFWQLALGRFGVGAGEAALNPAAYSMISDAFPRERLSTALAVFGAGALLGDMAAKLSTAVLMSIIPKAGVTWPLVGHLEPWRVVFLAVGLPGLLLGSLIWLCAEPPRSQRIGLTRIDYRQALRFMGGRWRFFLPFFLGCSLIYATNNAFGAWSATFLIRTYGVTVSQVGYLLAATTIAPQLIGILAAGTIADRLFAAKRTGVHMHILILMAVGKAALVWAGLAAGRFWLSALMFGLATMFSGIVAIGPAALQLVTPNEHRGQVSSSWLLTVNLVGLGLGPAITGALATFVWRDPGKIGWALATTFLLLQPIAILLIALAAPAMRRLVADADRWRAA